MLTVRELREILNDDALDADAVVMLATTPHRVRFPGAPGEARYHPLDCYGETRLFVAGPRTGDLVPYDEQDESYDEGEGEDSVEIFALWPREG